MIKYKKIVPIKLLNLYSVCLYFMTILLPIMRPLLGSYYNIIQLGLLIIWGITAFIIFPEWIFRFNLYMFLLTIQVVFFVGMCLFSQVGNPVSYMKIGLSFWIPAYIFYFYYVKNDKLCLNIIGKFIFLCIITTIFTTLLGYQLVPNASRVLAYSSNSIEEDLFLKWKNIGGFDFIYGIVILIPALFSSYLNCKSKRIIMFFLLLICIALVLKAQFTIAIITMILVFFVLLLMQIKSKIKYIYLILSCCLIIFIPRNQVGNFIINLSHHISIEKVQERIFEIGNEIIGNQIDGDLSIRKDVYSLSLNTIKDNVLTGIGPYYYISEAPIGYHSQLLDDFARYGILSPLWCCLFFTAMYFNQKRNWRLIGFKCNLFIVYCTFFSMSFFNLIFSQLTIGIIFFFLIPTLPLIIKNE